MFVAFFGSLATGQDSDLINRLNQLQKTIDSNQHRYDELEKKMDDVLWGQRVEIGRAHV
jgi:hypothetical protein